MNLIFIMIPKIAWTLTDRRLLRFCLLSLQLEIFLFSRYVGFSNDYPIPVVVDGRKHILYLRTKNDLSASFEIFVSEVYKTSCKEPQLIIDLGANFGETALYFHKTFPRAHIISVEPSPDSFRRLQKSFADFDRVTVINAAISAENGKIDFYTNEQYPMRNSLRQRSETDDKVVVRSVTLRSLLNSLGINKADILKFDIEGGEDVLFTNVIPAQIAHTIIGEFHSQLAKMQIDDFLSQFSDFSVQVQGDKEGEKCLISGTHP